MINNDELLKILAEKFKTEESHDDIVSAMCEHLHTKNKLTYYRFFRYMNERFQSPVIYPINNKIPVLSEDSSKSEAYKNNIYQKINSYYSEMYVSSALSSELDNLTGLIASLITGEGGKANIHEMNTGAIPNWLSSVKNDLSTKVMLLQKPGFEKNYDEYSTNKYFGYMMRSSASEAAYEELDDDGNIILRKYCPSMYDGSAFAAWCKIIVNYWFASPSTETERKNIVFNKNEDNSEFFKYITGAFFNGTEIASIINDYITSSSEFSYDNKNYIESAELFASDVTNIEALLNVFAFDFSYFYSIIVITQGLVLFIDEDRDHQNTRLNKLNMIEGTICNIREAMIYLSFDAIYKYNKEKK